MEPVLFVCFIISFAVTMMLVPRWIRKARAMNLVGHDMNKKGRPKVAEAGGITVIVGAVLGVLTYVFLNTFYFRTSYDLIDIFAFLTTMLLAGFIGFTDDILGWKAGMGHKTKVMSTIPIAVPLAVVNAGYSDMTLPFIGIVDFGVLFPLVLIPLGIIGATNGYNMLAGYNGMEAGLGAIMLSALGIVAWLAGSGWVSMLSGVMVCSLLAFYLYNRMPARVFPGDSMTYSIGAAIACIAILGNMEKFALVLFLPFMFDGLMFVRFRFIDRIKKVEAFGKVNSDGSIDPPYEKVYDYTHLAIKVLKRLKGKVYERDVTAFVLLTEAVLGIVVVLMWYTGL